MSRVKGIKEILKKYQAFPSKRLGQNFLIDGKILNKIIKSANLSKDDVVLEIGPGTGILTLELAKRAKKVIAVEKDEKMIEILKDVLKNSGIQNVQIIKGDILKLLTSHFQLPTSFKVVGNIPYYLTSRLIRRLLELKEKPKLIVLMVQKEVAQRICAKPPKMNLLAVSVQFYGKPEIVSYVPKKSFFPKPKVDSAIIKIHPASKSWRSQEKEEKFFKIVKAGFSQPRKQLINNLSKKLGIDKMKVREWLLKNGISPTARAETLNIENWLALTKSYKNQI